ncbi:RNA polymerase factor sigma-54 [Flavobacteriaceae bacterium]|jgi:RNA polymerase sigma-54 factor|nr:RNA polymerase factor sigma-54 [Flavobacteriaceae bacterium]MDA9284605.1 RNA polymerase factor sigma-54 [Flavobacteriaceae bacterium]MDA9572527.1 RNA polymerase factor sigma-54 [Flavobacteriaceae bacterium]MDB4133828.1 RNA polymerase factor sigma-54 [Flavobacteriaceae bacterium]MDB4212948.1 RNA polymerase factor sigma-54 [Flavobacteriaceae bacterium]
MLKQSLKLKLSQKLSPQQIQLMKLIQLPVLDFEQKLKQEIEENPALEITELSTNEDEFNDDDNIDIEDYINDDEIPDYKLNSYNSSNKEENSIPYASGVSFTQLILNQLHTERLNDFEMKIAEFLVGCIDEDGYIRQNLEDIIDDLAFTQNITTEYNTVDTILKIIQNLDPAGIGARSLQECLALQLKRKDLNEISIKLALNIIEHSFDLFTKRHFEKLLTKYQISEKELKIGVKEIERLNPKPGNSLSINSTKLIEQVIPDFKIEIVNDELLLTLNGRNKPTMNVSREYTEMLKGYSLEKNRKSQKEAVQFIKLKLDSAKWFIEAIEQREQTLMLTMKAIMTYQEAYFLSGDEKKIKPMILKNIADKIDMDISTISRVANSKYVDTPYGTKLIKEFFSESMINNKGEEISTIEIKKKLEKIILEEDKRKPETDDSLVKLLHKEGYKIARRTVSKYREQLNIPVARLRKQL